MIDLVLNAAKLILSKDARESATSLFELVRKMPQWKESICTMKARVSKESKEQSGFLCELTVTKMRQLDYSTDVIERFRLAFEESVSNAFEHGCSSSRAAVTLLIDVNKKYTSFSVINPRGTKLMLDREIDAARCRLRLQPRARRGRGLLLVTDSADDFASIKAGRGVKAVFERENVVIRVSEISDLVVLSCRSGLLNISFKRRLLAMLERHRKSDILLDFSLCLMGSVFSWVTLEAEALLLRADRRVVALLKREGSLGTPVVIPDELVAYTVVDALSKLGKDDLITEVREVIANPE